MTQNTLWQPSDISNSEAGTEGGEQDSPKRRGRIPQSAWPQILERYRAGATLSAIAREFECTPSAISYIVRKAEAGGATASEGAVSEESGKAVESTASAEPAAAPEAPAPRQSRRPPAAEATPKPAVTRQVESKPAEPARPAAETARPAEAPRSADTPRPADAPKTRLELKREEPRPAPAPIPEPAAAPAPVAAAEQPAAAPTQRPAGTPTPPVDEVEARLRETARGCLAAYRTWRQQPGQSSIQSLSDAVHDLRKVLARIEIDMSASRRDEQVARPIPIPAHRAARRPQ